MNTKPLIAIALVALFGANVASAQERVPASWNDSNTPNVAVQTSGKTRAEVKAELAAARANGELPTSADSYSTIAYAPFVSTKSRAEVKAEALHAMASGQGLSQGDRTGG